MLPDTFSVLVTMDTVVASLKKLTSPIEEGECYSSICPISAAARSHAEFPEKHTATIGSSVLVIREAIDKPSSILYQGGEVAAQITSMFDARRMDKLAQFLPQRITFTRVP